MVPTANIHCALTDTQWVAEKEDEDEQATIVEETLEACVGIEFARFTSVGCGGQWSTVLLREVLPVTTKVSRGIDEHTDFAHGSGKW